MFQPNIDSRGRALRAVGGFVVAVAAGLAWRHSSLLAVILGGVALFMFFEAVRGWCALRACKIETPF